MLIEDEVLLSFHEHTETTPASRGIELQVCNQIAERLLPEA